MAKKPASRATGGGRRLVRAECDFSLELNHQCQVHQWLATERRGAGIAAEFAEGCRITEVHCGRGSVKVIRLERILHVPSDLGVEALLEEEILLEGNLRPGH